MKMRKAVSSVVWDGIRGGLLAYVGSMLVASVASAALATGVNPKEYREVVGYLVREVASTQYSEPKAAEATINYLKACVALADGFASATDTGTDPAKTHPCELLAMGLHERMLKRDALIDVDDSTTGYPASVVRRESQAYEDFGMLSYFATSYISSIAGRKELLERKYFDQDDRDANIVEGWLNGHVGFLHFQDVPAWYRVKGVSAFEMTLRTEPVMQLDKATESGALLSAGLLLHFLPSVTTNADNACETRVDDSAFSKDLKRLGLRLGAGVRFDAGKTFIFGAGIQARSVTIWGLYVPHEKKTIFAAGLNDLEWFGKLMPWFGKLHLLPAMQGAR